MQSRSIKRWDKRASGGKEGNLSSTQRRERSMVEDTYKTVTLFIRHIRAQPSRQGLLKDVHLSLPCCFK